jgi:hypothetical protein
LAGVGRVRDNGGVSEEQEKSDNPVITGLVALVAVSLAVGLVLGGVALVGTKVLGINEDSSGSAGASEKETAIIPRPSKTPANGPLYTLDTQGPATDSTGGADDPQTDETKKPKQEKAITLQADQSAVGTFERIDISGVYPGGEGATLQVQRLQAGQWTDFPATIPVSGEVFRTYVQSAQEGVNKFRVVDNSTGETSNPITVTIG